MTTILFIIGAIMFTLGGVYVWNQYRIGPDDTYYNEGESVMRKKKKPCQIEIDKAFSEGMQAEHDFRTGRDWHSEERAFREKEKDRKSAQKLRRPSNS